MKTIETTLTNCQHSHQISNNKLKKTWRGDTKRSLAIWKYGVLWTISRTTVTTQRCSFTEEDNSEIDYIRTQKVFNHFNMADLEDYILRLA